MVTSKVEIASDALWEDTRSFAGAQDDKLGLGGCVDMRIGFVDAWWVCPRPSPRATIKAHPATLHPARPYGRWGCDTSESRSVGLREWGGLMGEFGET
jgi:hypothetical protein